MEISKGLEGVVVTNSAITSIDGKAGILRYRGYDIADLARYCTYEEVVYLIWFGELPTAPELLSFKEKINAEGELDQTTHAILKTFPKDAYPMDALRSAVSAMGLSDASGAKTPLKNREENLAVAIRLVAKTSSAILAFHRLRSGEKPLKSDPKQGMAYNFLTRLRGTAPEKRETEIFDTCLVLHADHEFNASAFSARVTASTLSDMYSAVTSAIGTLKGPLHGGANERVLKQLKEIGSLQNVDPYVERALERKERLMGFGHRIYKTEDPRATVLRELARELSTEGRKKEFLSIQEKVEKLVLSKKGLYPNVDFYSAIVYDHLSIPADLFTPIFACSRMAGWTAHILEQYGENRLIRPLSEYTGPATRAFVAIEKRGKKAAS